MARTKTKPTRAESLPPLGSALPIQLLRARESVMAWFRPHLRAHDLTDHQWRVLRALAETEEMEMQELSAACEVHPPSLSRIMPRLVELGLVRRGPASGDQRRIVARLTPVGSELIAKVSKGSTEIYRRLLGAVGEAELRSLQAALSALTTKLDRAREAAEEADEASPPAPPIPEPTRLRPRSGVSRGR